MATLKNRKDHAEHNEKALKYLDKTPEFLDWVITMAFYSALHFVKHKLFPLTEQTKDGHSFRHQSFESYFAFNRDKKIDKHTMLKNLVEDNCIEISAKYSHLLDICKTARYINYEYDRTESNLAKKYLEDIKEYCIR